MKTRLLPLLMAALPLVLGSAAGAAPAVASVHTAHPENWPALIGVGPLIVLVGVAISAAITVFAVLIRRQSALSEFTMMCARRLDGSRLSLFFWGLAELIAVMFVGFGFLRAHLLPGIGILVLLSGLTLVSFAVATAAVLVGQKCAPDSASDAGQFAVGAAVLAGASAVPVIGWLLCSALVLSSIGAVTEVALGKRPRQSLDMGDAPDSTELITQETGIGRD